ncbi:bifunctional methylenetetrahydrofolate dehydrogenase/methenyltetrahydrofolate cyclohydrolase FolD [Azospirillum brasilense]|uniref:bifunctional methylenetetrahydrofolate dehydrogenase/methenyltetrahydrofolate cyclohydrolase FolD n=1 Tax=Azospirillum brasilense TaxID=192 RepID=UPI000E693993|nr:bifunctional methylenetetrahydrofolate dehydrogenase/methenyltetrahydrofolate cyclohydrolase FolD [Azospirillum brasilense]NUB24136.1 bifunctional methylenetetrahydrofolate dehydrogenase/methenyltetrahydrofolate cyclohydrolase FolD [Azospirillum brasilense]NUB31948.1 bifunctional methylenetetrahydrofolate dehydrogenase/methenyltetrahydrofolate cyclohydrolase FolD [Azospirillum brasilense]RIW01816.1 bifunctional methylenetetrahydrofolate dehydrogenase/methenyltetrahydrofolate cyclohydrolase Fo
MAEAKIIDGKAFAAGLRARVAEGVAALKASHGVTPGLAVVLVGEDPASQVYVRSKEKALADLGMNSFDHHMPADLGEAELLALIDRLNADPAVHGILVQLPLPKHIDTQKVLARIVPEKDADGFHVVNAGLLATGSPGAIVPCTPLGSLLLLRDTLGADLKGKRSLVLGRSNIVGKPMAQLLLQQDCTVTVAHSRTQDLPGECRRADILVAAVGRPEMVRGDWIKPGAVVIDVGINRVPHPTEPGKTKLVGDVAYDEAVKVAGAITPVPGGVGPMTIACLMLNTLAAACRAAGAPVPAEALA